MALLRPQWLWCMPSLLSLSLLLLLLPGSTTAAADGAHGAVDVCPVNSLHKSLPFLKAAKPNALDGLLPSSTSSLSIDMAAVTDFVKTTLVPLIGANVFFFALALLLLLVFIIWRLFRWCCVVCCCRGSCDLKRAKNDPGAILFGKRMKINKSFMIILGLVSVAFAVYGLATVDKSVTDGAFNVLTRISDYANRAFDTLDGLLDTIRGTTDIINDFQLVVTVDINVDAIAANMTVVGVFLDTAPTPAVVLANVNGMTTRVRDLGSALVDLDGAINSTGTFTTAVTNPGWSNTFGIIRDAGAAGTNIIGGMKLKADNLQAAIGTALGVAQPPSNVGPEVANLETAVVAVYNDLSVAGTHWIAGTGRLDAIALNLENGVGVNNPFSALKAKVVSVKTIALDISTTRYDAMFGIINNLTTQYIAVEPAMAGLLQKMVYINDSILVLPTAMQDAYDKLADAKAKLDRVMATPPTPTTLLANLTTFKNGMPSLAPLDDLIGNLTQAKNALFAIYPQADTAAYITWLRSIVRPAISGMAGVSVAGLAGSRLEDLKNAVSAYKAGSGTWAAASASITSLRNAGLDDLVGLTGFGDATETQVGPPAGRVHDYAAKAGAMGAPAGAFSVPATGAGTYGTQARSAILTMPDTSSLTSNMGGVSSAYAALGPTPSAVMTGPKSQLADIKTAAVTNGDNVKAQITQTVTTFRGSTGSLKDMVVNQLGDIRAKYQDPAKVYDGYRYMASMALYGVSILFVVLILASCFANYHFGANISTFLLLLITILYFLLAVIIALLISVLYMGCNELEPLALRLAPAQVTPLLEYYFYGSDSDSVATVLKNANLVDIGAVKAQVLDTKGSVAQGLSGSFTWRDNPLNPRNPFRLVRRINDTIDTAMMQVDSLLGLAGRTQLFGVYSDVKAYMCCGVPDMLAPMWTGLTMAGVFALALIFATFFFIGKLDRVPRKDCCGCTCHTRARYAGTVYPGEGGGVGGGSGGVLPQYAAPGWEHPMGPYAAPPNGAMWVPMDDHGTTVNVVVAGQQGQDRVK